MINVWLFLQFAKFSLMLFGGGYMIVPLLVQIFVEEKSLLTLDKFGNLMAIAQMTPGAVSMNAATYIGFLENKILGSIAASLGLIFPTLFLGMIAISLLNKWKNTQILTGILRGARLAALSMIIFACLIFMDISIFSTPVPYQSVWRFLTTFEWVNDKNFMILPFETIIALISCLLSLKTKIPIVPLIVGTGCLGALAVLF